LNSRRKQDLQTAPPLTIGALSRATHIPAETLRTWERRYGTPKPTRKPSGHRVYAAESVEHLKRVGQLLARGLRPAEVLTLSPRELLSLLRVSAPEASRMDAPPAATEGGPPALAMDSMLRAAAQFDREALMGELRANWARLGPLRFLQDLAGPFMAEVGKAWARKSLEIRHEHFATGCLSDFLREARQPFDQRARGPRVAAATLPGDLHEGGLLMASSLLAVRGFRVIYLGADIPIEQIAAAAEQVAVVLVSVSSGMPRRSASEAIASLREALPYRMPLWLGGAGAPPALKRVERFESLDALDARLATFA
jgi:methanogenic corrinoid protein MtbC1